MDLVTQFHDTLFDESCNKTKSHRSVDGNYTPKLCPAEWFNEDGNEGAENASRIKFRADRLYFKGKYEEAIENYSNVIPLLESSNATIRRDSLEGMIRSAIKLKDLIRAELWIDELMQMAKSSTQLCSVWKLKAELYFLNKNFKDEICMWKNVLGYHQFCYEYWLNLGKSYANLHRIPLGVTTINNDVNIRVLSNDQYNIILLITSCLIRCRVLLETIDSNQRHLNYQKKQDIKKQINVDIQSFSLPIIFLTTAQENMSRDIRKDDEKSEFEDISKLEKKITTNSSLTNYHQEFDKIWFSWLVQFHKQ